MNWKLAALKSYSLRSQFATSIPPLFIINRYVNQSHIATSSNLKSQNAIASSMFQIATLNEICTFNSIKQCYG